MYDKRNEYLRRRSERRNERDYRGRRMNDYYGNPSVYMEETPTRYHDYYGREERDYRRDYRYNSPMRNEYDHRERRERDYRSSDDYEEEYYEDLKDWIKRLKEKDRFKVSKDTIIKRASEMGIKFDEISEEEFYATYLMHVSDYPKVSNDYNLYISMAKDFLMDDDIAVSPSEKLCVYFYKIVEGEDD